MGERHTPGGFWDRSKKVPDETLSHGKPDLPPEPTPRYSCFVAGCPGNHPSKYGVCASPTPQASKERNPHERWLRKLAAELQSATPPTTSCIVLTVLQAANEIGTLSAMERDIAASLTGLGPLAIRCAEGGGAENVAQSVAATFAKLQKHARGECVDADYLEQFAKDLPHRRHADEIRAIAERMRCTPETTCDPAKLEFALRGLYWDQVDYLTLNKLGGMNNHWMRAARGALGMDPDDTRPVEPTQKPDAWLVDDGDGWRYLTGGEGDARARMAQHPQRKLYPLYRGTVKTSAPICPTCKTELAFEGDVCGLCLPVAQP